MEELKRENERLREENGQLREEVRHLRLRLGISEGLPPAAGGGRKEVAVCDRRCGHALPKLMALLCAKICIVSTPEHGGPPDERGGYSVPVMSGLERLAGYVFPQVLGSYDFKGSASQRECAAQVPDRDIHDWGDPAEIEKTQWFRYWSGRVRSALSATVLQSVPAAGDLLVKGCNTVGLNVAAGSRTLFAVSLAGGTVTQTEYKALPRLISGTVADLSTRDLELGGITVKWLHFESFEDLVKALQGYGGLDYGGDMSDRQKFGLPGRWVDGPYNEAHDLLKGVPGATPAERRAFLLAPQPREQGQLNAKLANAIRAKDAERTRELLGLGPDNAAVAGAEGSSSVYADPNFSPWEDGERFFSFAASKFNLEAMEALLAAGADPCAVKNDGYCALAVAVQVGAQAPTKLPGVAERVEAVVERCAQAQLGTSYAAHVASLTVGARVTWTTKLGPASEAGDFAGTIVAVNDARAVGFTRLVEGASSGEQVWLNPGHLRLG